MTARGWAGRWLVAEEAFVGGNENLVCGGGGSRADVCTLAAMSAVYISVHLSYTPQSRFKMKKKKVSKWSFFV